MHIVCLLQLEGLTPTLSLYRFTGLDNSIRLFLTQMVGVKIGILEEQILSFKSPMLAAVYTRPNLEK